MFTGLCSLWQDVLASDFLLFSLLLPFDHPSVPVSPSLASELHLDSADPVFEWKGKLTFTLGEIADERAEVESKL